MFWGREVKVGQNLSYDSRAVSGRILHINRATLGEGTSSGASVLKCAVGENSPIYLCSLRPDTAKTCPLDLKFQENAVVLFSTTGPRSIHLSGFIETDQPDLAPPKTGVEETGSKPEDSSIRDEKIENKDLSSIGDNTTESKPEGSKKRHKDEKSEDKDKTTESKPEGSKKRRIDEKSEDKGKGKLDYSKKKRGTSLVELERIPPSRDWREFGIITPVKDQTDKQICWAYPVADSISALGMLNTGDSVDLSAQQLVDCVDVGTTGGRCRKAFHWVFVNWGLQNERAYSYTGIKGRCKPNMAPFLTGRIRGYGRVDPRDERALMERVACQPVTVTLRVNKGEFHRYERGIYRKHYGVDYYAHAVLLVGYDTDEKGVPYWIVKNSYGEEWGYGGYMHLLKGYKGGEDGEGMCGVTLSAWYPVY